MQSLSIDIETFSPINLAQAGVYTYCDHPDFRILLFSYTVDDGQVQTVDLANGEHIPPEVLAALEDRTVIKYAFNASFERTCLSRFVGHQIDPAGWRCTMVWAATLTLPLSLKALGAVLRLETQKMSQGQALIKYFCTPTPTGVRHLPADDLPSWQTFREYNRRDVEVENLIRAKLSRLPVSEHIWEQYEADQRINDRGIRIDQKLVTHAISCDTNYRAKAIAQAQQLTGLENPASPIQLKDWLHAHGCLIPSMSKTDVADALTDAHGAVRKVLELRQELSRSSVAKYGAMQASTARDGRAHGLLQFYGANRTGRWAGRLIQVQNLPRNMLPDLAQVRALVRGGNFDALDLLYPSIPDTLSQLVRTAFIPSPGNRFIVADYSAIEARVLAWLAGETSTLAAFERGEDLYCATASAMFGVPVEKHGANSELRQKGKIAVLACGYNGSVGALKAMGALSMGLAESELGPIVDAWRAANPHIVALWHAIDQAAIKVIKTGWPQTVGLVRLAKRSGFLAVTLPSGRSLLYAQPGLGVNRFGGTSITYWGLGESRKWVMLETYGGKLVENIVQAIARDLLAEAIMRLEAAGLQIVMHVHDEVVIDEPKHSATTVGDVCALMNQLPAWAAELPIDAAGYECEFYMKD